MKLKVKKKSNWEIISIILIIIFIIANLFLFYYNYKKWFVKEKNEIYCVGGDILTEEYNYIAGMKCYILRFEYNQINENFYNELLNNTHRKLMSCSKYLNDNECNYYDNYYYKKDYVNDSDMIGYVSEFIGIRYKSGNYSYFENFLNESEKLSYKEGYERLRK